MSWNLAEMYKIATGKTSMGQERAFAIKMQTQLILKPKFSLEPLALYPGWWSQVVCLHASQGTEKRSIYVLRHKELSNMIKWYFIDTSGLQFYFLK